MLSIADIYRRIELHPCHIQTLILNVSSRVLLRRDKMEVAPSYSGSIKDQINTSSGPVSAPSTLEVNCTGCAGDT